ncbi:MAG: hypothetical protein KDA51_00795, partial [Planctomycetales bacterium]|nr:hypothetical protein [Planctomycetales bacterium]
MFFRQSRKNRKKSAWNQPEKSVLRQQLVEALEDRRMLATITPVAVSGGYELQLAYDAGETILDLPDVYLRTDGSGNLEFSPTSSGPYADLGANLSDGSVSSLSVAVTFAAQSDSDALAALQGLGVDPFSTLNVMGIVAPGVDLSLSAISIHVGPGTAINTRTLATGADPLTAESMGDSGDLSLDGAVISVEGALLTQVGDADITNAAGDISIIAKGNLSDLVSGFVVVPGPIP